MPLGEITASRRRMTASQAEPGQLGDLIERRGVEGLESRALTRCREVGPRPGVGQQLRLERADERHLHQDVDGRADQDRQDHRSWQVTLGVAALTTELDGLFESEQRKDDATAGYRDQNVFDLSSP